MSFCLGGTRIALLGLVVALAPAAVRANLDDFVDSQSPGAVDTSRGTLDERVFLKPSPGLDTAGKMDFVVGQALFERLWVSAPASTRSADGLGPLFNARSCHACHVRGGRGHPPEAGDSVAGLVVRLGVDGVVPDPVYGRQLQTLGLQGHAAEGRVVVDYREQDIPLAGGEAVSLREPIVRIEDLAYGGIDAGTRLSPRIAPPLIGLGLLESIDMAQLEALADPGDADGDGISGRINVVPDEGGIDRTGRFGWKAGAPSVDAQTRMAFVDDLGISVPGHPEGWGDCTGWQRECRDAPNGNSPEAEDLEAPALVVEMVNHYVRNLAVPMRRNVADPSVVAGETLFRRIGCHSCHRPAFETTAGIVRPYSDLLLHDMGEALADGFAEGSAAGREWRTAPLWGLGLTGLVSGRVSLLHDGRARTILEAILWHGGEASTHAERVRTLDPEDRRNLVAFIESL